MKAEFEYGNETVVYELKYSDRKTLGIEVHPDMSLLVKAPLDASLYDIEKKLKSKSFWIKRQKEKFLTYQPLTPPRTYQSGETHLYLGRRYRLKLKQADNNRVRLSGKYFYLQSKDPKDKKLSEYLLKAWYSAKAKTYFSKLLTEHKHLIKNGFQEKISLQNRWMTKRWGSCTIAGKITLNNELIKAPKTCIEYVIVHELCHLVEHSHNASFYRLLDSIRPYWRDDKEKLEAFMA